MKHSFSVLLGLAVVVCSMFMVTGCKRTSYTIDVNTSTDFNGSKVYIIDINTGDFIIVIMIGAAKYNL